MPIEPIEKNHEHFSDEALRIQEAAKATPEQSITALQKILQTKNDRMQNFELPKNLKSLDQFNLEKDIIDRRLMQITSMA